MNTSGKFFAVLDTETNFCDQVMSIGVVIADKSTFHPIDAKYYILENVSQESMFAHMLNLERAILRIRQSSSKLIVDTLIKKNEDNLFDLKQLLDIYIQTIDTRDNVCDNIAKILNNFDIKDIFAYNAQFDYRHLYELSNYNWFDIMSLAAYRQFNTKIPKYLECCKTGRLRKTTVLNQYIGY